MQDGIITIEMWDYRATSNIRFETKGFNITTEALDTKHCTVNGRTYSGYADITNNKRYFVPYSKAMG